MAYAPCVKVLGHAGGRRMWPIIIVLFGNLSGKLPVILDFCANLKHKIKRVLAPKISVCCLPK